MLKLAFLRYYSLDFCHQGINRKLYLAVEVDMILKRHFLFSNQNRHRPKLQKVLLVFVDLGVYTHLHLNDRLDFLH